MKKIISLLLVITFVFTLGGCFGEETEKVTPEDVKNRVISEAKEYLKENYPDDEFTYISGRSPNWAYNYYELGFSSKNYDDQLVTVYGDLDEEKKTEDGLTVYNYYDDYYQYYMLEDAEKYFYDLAKNCIEEDLDVKVVFYTGIGYAQNIDNGMNFIQNAKNKNLTFVVKFFSNCSSKDTIEETKNKYKAIAQNLADSNIDADILYIFDESVTINGSNYIEYSIKDGVVKEIETL